MRMPLTGSKTPRLGSRLKEWSRTTNKGKSETVITKEAKMLMIGDKLIAKMKQFQGKRAWGEGKNAPRLPDGVDKRWGLSGERGRKTTTKEILSLFDENICWSFVTTAQALMASAVTTN